MKTASLVTAIVLYCVAFSGVAWWVEAHRPIDSSVEEVAGAAVKEVTGADLSWLKFIGIDGMNVGGRTVRMRTVEGRIKEIAPGFGFRMVYINDRWTVQ